MGLSAKKMVELDLWRSAIKESKLYWIVFFSLSRRKNCYQFWTMFVLVTHANEHMCVHVYGTCIRYKDKIQGCLPQSGSLCIKGVNYPLQHNKECERFLDFIHAKKRTMPGKPLLSYHSDHASTTGRCAHFGSLQKKISTFLSSVHYLC